MAFPAWFAAAMLLQAAPSLTLPYLDAPAVAPAPSVPGEASTSPIPSAAPPPASLAPPAAPPVPITARPMTPSVPPPPSPSAPSGDTDVSASDREAAAFSSFVRSLRPGALAAGVAPATFDRETADLALDPRVVRSDRAQPGGGGTGAPTGTLNFAPYRRQHVDAAHISGGRQRYPALRPQLSGVERRTGVPEAIMLAIYGQETGYGSFSGRLDLLRSLATLAYEGRRRELFATEFVDTLKLVDRAVPRSQLKGSWAGATGYPQFLPSVYLRLGTDGDGDGRIDIWTSEADALASIGRYLQDAGWKPDVPWGIPVMIPAGFDRTTLGSPLVSPRCPRVHARLSRWRSIAEWRALGLVATGDATLSDEEQATLVEPDGPGAQAYLVTGNYQVILDYNCSNLYALSIGVLADEITH